MKDQLEIGTFEALAREEMAKRPEPVRSQIYELAVARHARIAALLRQVDTEMRRSCVTCDHFKAGHCADLDSDVPNWFQPFGCESFLEEIPF